MTKRLASMALAAAGAAALLMPAAPASAHHCWNWFTTPRQCAEDLLKSDGPSIGRICYVEGTQLKCPGLGSGS